MSSTGRPLEGRRILVVEDDYFLARDACEWLQDAGAAVVGPAPTSQLACDLLKREAVNSAVIDINLGTGPTYEVATHLLRHGVPFLFATGYDQETIASEFSAAPRIQKPFRGEQLVEAVSKLR